MRKLYQLLMIVLFSMNLTCTHSTESEENDDDTFVPQLSAISVPWTSENSIVCFGTSLTFGYGAGGRVLFCKDDRDHEETLPKQNSNETKHKKYLSFSTKYILEKHKEANLNFEINKVTYGTCGCTGDSSYPRFLGEKLKIKVYNQGYVAMRSDQALTLIQDSVLSKKPSIVLLEFGANDFLQNYSDSSAEKNISSMIELIAAYGSKIVLIGFIHPDMANHVADGDFLSEKKDLAIQYYTMLNRIAAKYHILYVQYPLYKIYGDRKLMSDDIHPNGIGYLRMSENIKKALFATFSLNKMLK